MAQGSTTNRTVGNVAHDAVDAGDPLKIGGKAASSTPTAVEESDRVNAWLDLLGRLIVTPFHATPQTAHAEPSNTTEADLVAAPGSGLSIYVVSLHGSNAGASLSTIAFRDGTGSGNNKFNFAMAANGGGFTVNLNVPWKLTTNTALKIAQSASVQIYTTVTYYIAP
jgi:hypothetical protein